MLHLEKRVVRNLIKFSTASSVLNPTPLSNPAFRLSNDGGTVASQSKQNAHIIASFNLGLLLLTKHHSVYLAAACYSNKVLPFVLNRQELPWQPHPWKRLDKEVVFLGGGWSWLHSFYLWRKNFLAYSK